MISRVKHLQARQYPYINTSPLHSLPECIIDVNWLACATRFDFLSQKIDFIPDHRFQLINGSLRENRIKSLPPLLMQRIIRFRKQSMRRQNPIVKRTILNVRRLETIDIPIRRDIVYM